MHPTLLHESKSSKASFFKHTHKHMPQQLRESRGRPPQHTLRYNVQSKKKNGEAEAVCTRTPTNDVSNRFIMNHKIYFYFKYSI